MVSSRRLSISSGTQWPARTAEVDQRSCTTRTTTTTTTTTTSATMTTTTTIATICEHESQASHVLQFYQDQSVLLTGASGFVGKLVLEKLLRTCTGVRHVYVLMRPRRNKRADERLAELFDAEPFGPLRALVESAAGGQRFEQFVASKVVLLEGDLTRPLLGLADEQLEQLRNDRLSVVLHSAALVSFDKQLLRSVSTNLIGTHNVLELARRLPDLKALVYVSTCYSNCAHADVDDHIYPVQLEPRKLIELVNHLDGSLVELLRPKLLNSHPNSYTYAKQMAEYLCGQYALEHELPVIICRPSIVVSTLSEPLVGFTDNINGGNGIFEAVASGLCRTLAADPLALMDLAPADFVVNCILASAFFAHHYHKARRHLEQAVSGVPEVGQWARDEEPLASRMAAYYLERRARLAKKLALKGGPLGQLVEPRLLQVPVLHASTGAENPLNYGQILADVAEGARRNPSARLLRDPYCVCIPNKRLHRVAHFFLDTLFALLLTRGFWLRGELHAGHTQRRTKFKHRFVRFQIFSAKVGYFLRNSWHFSPEARLRLAHEFMSDADRRLFNCQLGALDWRHFGRQIALGLRRYQWRESDATLERARVRYVRLYWLHHLLHGLLFAGLSFMLVSLGARLVRV